ncbi:MAG: FAD-dependent thymidylate synthase [Candidatus Aminicenantes bacterium]|nr:MAG: FAD-dependent thymidylate synthase [Candidatus Aminicenantes bacterium]
MNIKLAGYNVEAEILEKLTPLEGEPLTPEVLSAAYARISRSEKDIPTLRQEARKDVYRARKSNKTIIFKMGHHSVAEHAVFNFDILGVSRLALEEIEKFRLVSYTEKSQRYVTLAGDYVLPVEIIDNHDRKCFNEMIELQNAFYKRSFDILKECLLDKYPDRVKKKSGLDVVEGWAKEDARYILSLATQGQVGVTINARNLEHLFRRFSLSQRKEVREIGKEMFNQVEKVAPSLILFPEPSKFETALKDSFKTYVLENSPIDSDFQSPGIIKEPVLLQYTQNADDLVLASFLAMFGSMDYNRAYGVLEGMKPGEKENLFKELFKHMEFFDAPPRDFEWVDFTFQAVVSASNFAQLKRHRMATLIPGDYDIGFENTIPESIRESGLEGEFKEIIAETNRVYLRLRERYGPAADYILTNSHCRPVVMKMNLREFYHFVRLRSDEHTQWDIRDLSDQLLRMVKEIMPYAAMLLCGKSDFVEEFERIYNKKWVY